MSELWEIVRADRLRAGDTIKPSSDSLGFTVKSVDIFEYPNSPDDRFSVLIMSLDLGGEVFTETENRSRLFFRCVPDAEDPRVLRRALELAVEYMSGTDKAAQMEVVAEFIEDARKELESEGTK